MRTSVLSRSVIVAASLAVGSATLAMAPATAASPSGVTRDMVLAAANGVRGVGLDDYSQNKPAARALLAIANRGCAPQTDEGEVVAGAMPLATQAGAGADGVVLYVPIVNFVEQKMRYCVVGAIAATDPARTLSGSMTVDVIPVGPPKHVVQSASLTGDVTLTAALNFTENDQPDAISMTATGTADLTTTTWTTRKVAVTQTKAHKKHAKKKYAAATASAKKSYAKALKKAGHSPSKKATAKKAYAAKRVAAKKAYTKATATSKTVKTPNTTVNRTPFTVNSLDTSSTPPQP